MLWFTIGLVAGVVAALLFDSDMHARSQKMFTAAIEYYKTAELLHKNARLLHERVAELLVENEDLGRKIDDKIREMREAGN